MNQYQVVILTSIEKFISEIPSFDKEKILASIACIQEGDFQSVYIKTLKSPIKELIVKKYRLIFFIDGKIIYFIEAFIKKTAKTPRIEIGNAQNIYHIIKNNN